MDKLASISVMSVLFFLQACTMPNKEQSLADELSATTPVFTCGMNIKGIINQPEYGSLRLNDPIEANVHFAVDPYEDLQPVAGLGKYNTVGGSPLSVSRVSVTAGGETATSQLGQIHTGAGIVTGRSIDAVSIFTKMASGTLGGLSQTDRSLTISFTHIPEGYVLNESLPTSHGRWDGYTAKHIHLTRTDGTTDSAPYITITELTDLDCKVTYR